MIQPIKNNILVKPFTKSSTDSGILLPFHKETDRVEVIAVGNGTVNKPMKLRVGDIGYRVHEWGTPIIDNNQTYYLMDAAAILTLE